MAATGCPATLDALVLSDSVSSTDARLMGPALIVVDKSARRLGLYTAGSRVEGACWRVGLAPGAAQGPKRHRGDRKTPEGLYATSDKPWSQFYGAIAVHYPGVADAEAGQRAGLITQQQRDDIAAAVAAGRKPDQGSRLGGEILVHGGGGSSDWTLGCVALDDTDLDSLRAQLPAGMRTDILIVD